MKALEERIRETYEEQNEKNEYPWEASDGNTFLARYKGFVQRHRSLAFLKNMAISGVAFVGGGFLGAKAVKYGTDSKTLISAGSLIGQYIAGCVTFWPLHAMDNYDIYKGEDNKFKYKEFVKDGVKLVFGLGVLEAMYIIGRPALHYTLMRKGIEPGTASLYSDMICMPAYWMLSAPLAKLFGVIKKNKA